MFFLIIMGFFHGFLNYDGFFPCFFFNYDGIFYVFLNCIRIFPYYSELSWDFSMFFSIT